MREHLHRERLTTGGGARRTGERRGPLARCRAGPGITVLPHPDLVHHDYFDETIRRIRNGRIEEYTRVVTTGSEATDESLVAMD